MDNSVPVARQVKTRRGVKQLLSGVLIALLGVMGLVSLPTMAVAATAATITSANFTKSEFPGGSRQEVNVKWKVHDNPITPLTVSIDLPDELRGFSDTFPAEAGAGAIAGECVVTADRVTCSIDDAYVNANPRNISGSFTFLVDVHVYNSTTETRTYEFGAVSAPVVTITPNPEVCADECEYQGTQGFKYGWYNTSDDTIQWNVGVAAPGPNGLAPGSTVTVIDELDTDLFEVVGKPVVTEAGSVRVNDYTQNEELVWKNMPADLVRVSDDNLTVSFTSRAGVSGGELTPGARELSGAVYSVWWTVRVLDGGKAGEYTNTAEWIVESVDRNTERGRVFRQSGSGNVVGTNFGKFAVSKQLTGDAVLSDTLDFTINWTAFESASDTQGVPGSATIKAGESFTSEEFFKGTRILLTEVTPVGPANVDWAAPTFIETDAQGKPLAGATPSETLDVTFSEANGNLARVSFFSLTNEAALQKAPVRAKAVVDNPDSVDLTAVDAFTLNYSYPAGATWGAGSGALELPADGTVATSADLPVGAELTLSETTPAAIAGATWAVPVLSTETLVVGADSEAVVTVTNAIARDLGGLSLEKSLSGSGAGLVPAGTEFVVKWAYDAGPGFAADAGEARVVAGGPAVTVSGLPAGAEVRLSEVAPNPVTGGSWLAPVFSKSTVTVIKDQVVAVSLDNPIQLNTGTFKLRKQLEGSGAGLVGADATFAVDYTYPSGIGFEAGSGSITATADGSWVSSTPLPYGATVTLDERPAAPVPGATWEGHAFDRATLTIGDGTAEEITLTNTATRDVGSFELQKGLTGSGAHLARAGAEYTFEYSYPAGDTFAGGEGTVTVASGGDPVLVGNIPAGAVVTLTEVGPAPIAGASWLPVVFDGPETFVTAKDATTSLVATNELELDLGGFGVHKTLAGDGASLVADGTAFEVRYSYPAGPGFEAGEGTLSVTASGETGYVDGLPAGAVVTLSEAPAAAVPGGTWQQPTFSADTLTIPKDGEVEVELTNTITITPTDTPGKGDPHTGGPNEGGKGTQPDSKLAASGSSPLSALGVGTMLMLIVAGAALAVRGARRAGSVS